jgi:hypothetical protein
MSTPGNTTIHKNDAQTQQFLVDVEWDGTCHEGRHRAGNCVEYLLDLIA